MQLKTNYQTGKPLIKLNSSSCCISDRIRASKAIMWWELYVLQEWCEDGVREAATQHTQQPFKFIELSLILMAGTLLTPARKKTEFLSLKLLLLLGSFSLSLSLSWHNHQTYNVNISTKKVYEIRPSLGLDMNGMGVEVDFFILCERASLDEVLITLWTATRSWASLFELQNE